MGEVGGFRGYDGPGLGSAPWKCPRCGAENSGLLDVGCTSCGSGSAPARHVGVQPPPVTRRAGTTPLQGRPLDDDGAIEFLPPAKAAATERPQEHSEASAWAAQWTAQHPTAGPFDAFLAGYLCALQIARAHLMQAPPVTADVASLAPSGKVRRTIIAALELFKDRVLPEAQEEIASGEWCSIEEVEQVLQQLRDEDAKETTT